MVAGRLKLLSDCACWVHNFWVEGEQKVDRTLLPPVGGEVGKIRDFGHPVPIRLGCVAWSAQLHQHGRGGLWSVIEQHLHPRGLSLHSMPQVCNVRPSYRACSHLGLTMSEPWPCGELRAQAIMLPPPWVQQSHTARDAPGILR